MVSMLVASVRELTTGPSTNEGLMTQSLNPCSLDSSQAARSAATCARRAVARVSTRCLKEPAQAATAGRDALRHQADCNSSVVHTTALPSSTLCCPCKTSFTSLLARPDA